MEAVDDIADFLFEELGDGMRMNTLAKAARSVEKLVRTASLPSHPIIADMARVGHHGRWASNQERDFHSVARRWNRFGLQPYPLTLDLQQPDDSAPVLSEVLAIAPHELVAALWRARPEQRNLSLCGPSGEASVEEWWGHARELQHYKSHPGSASAKCTTMAWNITLQFAMELPWTDAAFCYPLRCPPIVR